MAHPLKLEIEIVNIGSQCSLSFFRVMVGLSELGLIFSISLVCRLFGAQLVSRADGSCALIANSFVVRDHTQIASHEQDSANHYR